MYDAAIGVGCCQRAPPGDIIGLKRSLKMIDELTQLIHGLRIASRLYENHRPPHHGATVVG